MWDKPPSQLIKAGGERGELSLRGHWGLGWLSAETGRPVATGAGKRGKAETSFSYMCLAGLRAGVGAVNMAPCWD